MKSSDLSFDLPEELIAQHPSERRGASRLLVVDRDSGRLTDSRVAHLLDHVPRGALLVFNDTRVRKARVLCSAGSPPHEVELLFVEPAPDGSWWVIGRGGRRLRPGRTLILPDGGVATVREVEGHLRRIEIEPGSAIDNAWFDQWGHVPLPPYIRRSDEPADSDRYQTVYARPEATSVAAPTAGLHFTDLLLAAIDARFERTAVTLHVGIGTFLPVQTERLEDHAMHREEFEVSPEAAGTINRARAERRPIVAVGTTVVRTLESACTSAGEIVPGRAATELFITPGFPFRVVDHLFTNFHTPGSTLVALVSAFAGAETIRTAYRHAIEQRYRFYSYGDAMLIR